MMNHLIVFFTSFILLILIAHKWELEMKIIVPWSVLMGILACFTLLILKKISYSPSLPMQLLIAIIQSFFISGIAVLMLFFRDPERRSPKNGSVIFSHQLEII